jgi:hypothetical protein
MIKVMVDCPALVSLRVFGPTCTARAQVLISLEHAVPAHKRVLRRIAEQANGQSDALVQLDVKLYGSQPILE